MARANRASVMDKGAALVEMALVLPLLLMLIIGVFATARAWQVHNVMDHAVREAARFGATIDPWDDATSPGEVMAVAQAELDAASVAGAIQECIGMGDAPCGANAVGNTDQVVVRLQYPDYRLDFVFFSITIDMRAEAFARYES